VNISCLVVRALNNASMTNISYFGFLNATLLRTHDHLSWVDFRLASSWEPFTVEIDLGCWDRTYKYRLDQGLIALSFVCLFVWL